MKASSRKEYAAAVTHGWKDHDALLSDNGRHKKRKKYFSATLTRRNYELRAAQKELDLDVTRILEIGTAGCVAVPITFPSSACIGVDIDMVIFGNETNYFPRLPVGYYGDMTLRGKRSVDRRLPNYRRIVAEAERMPLEEGSVDTIVVFSEPSLARCAGRSIERLLKPGGVFASIIGVVRKTAARSFYDSDSYTTYSLGSQPKLNHLRSLEPIIIPSALRELEFVTSTTIDGKKHYLGTVFEAFQKTA